MCRQTQEEVGAKFSIRSFELNIPFSLQTQSNLTQLQQALVSRIFNELYAKSWPPDPRMHIARKVCFWRSLTNFVLSSKLECLKIYY